MNRDNQKRRLYLAELPLRDINVSKYAKHLDGTITGCQKYVNAIVSHAWFRRRWGTIHIEVEAGKGARGGSGVIRLAKWARNEVVILHEITHNLVPSSRYAAHGPEFAGVFQFLVTQVMGKEYGAKLKKSYKENRVRSNRKALPKPDTKVKSMYELAAAKREAKREPLSYYERDQLTKLLDRGIKAGQFGLAGSKSRNDARKVLRQISL